MRKHNPKDNAAYLPFTDVAFHEKWQEWLQYRKERRLPNYVATGLKRTYAKLVEDSGNDPVVACQIIDQSISQNWQGLFPLKNQSNGKAGVNNGKSGQLSDDKLKEALLRNIASQ